MKTGHWARYPMSCFHFLLKILVSYLDIRHVSGYDDRYNEVPQGDAPPRNSKKVYHPVWHTFYFQSINF